MMTGRKLKSFLARRNAVVIGCVLAVLGLAACSGGQPTVIIMQITNTPDPRLVEVTVTNTGVPPTSESAGTIAPGQPSTSAVVVPTVIPTMGALPTEPPSTLTSAAIAAATSATAGTPSTLIPVASAVAPAQGATSTVSAMPTDTRAQLYIAQEDFQHGYVFWISVRTEIWVCIPDPGSQITDQPPTKGQWLIFKDTYVDSEPETDPSIIPPASNLYQPRRGFGKLWRSNTTVRGALGWGTTPEFGLTTSYVYQPGGSVNQSGQWVPGPGTHFIVTLGRDTFAFHEPQPGQQYGTWEKVG